MNLDACQPSWHQYLTDAYRQGPNVRLLRSAGCSLSVTVDVRAKGSPAGVPDNRPLSDGSVGRSLFLEIERQLAHGLQERWLVDGDVGPDAVTMTLP